MPERNIVTQSGLSDLKFELNQIAENLNEHVNGSLSKAHGINLEHGYIDASGNDLTKYRDSAGDIVGTKQIRFFIDGVNYFAPCNLTSQPGQAESTGAIDTSGDSVVAGIDKTAWITDFASQQVQEARNINEDVLLPHTHFSHEDVHGSIAVVNQSMLDTQGHIVGRFQLRLVFNGVQYAIPADTHLGGPPQVAQFIEPTDVSNVGHAISASHRANPGPFVVTVTGGLMPVSFQWEVNSQGDGLGTWTALPGPDGSSVTINGGITETIYFGAATNTLTLFPSSNSVWRFRCLLTNPAGSVYTRVATLFQYGT